MSESVIADFVGKFNADALNASEPVPGRVLLSQKRIVLAAREDDKLTVPLSAIYDVAVGHVPPDLGNFFDPTVTVAFERDGVRHVAAVEGEQDNVDKFAALLFRVLLDGTEVSIVERDQVGGLVTDDEFRTAEVEVFPDAVSFGDGDDDAFVVSLADVEYFERGEREVDGSLRPVVRVRHLVGDRPVTTVISTPTPRRLSILGRYLRQELRDVVTDLPEEEVTTVEKELLVGVYATEGTDADSLSAIVDADDDAVTSHLASLANDGLVTGDGDGFSLTPAGRVLANRSVDDVFA